MTDNELLDLYSDYLLSAFGQTTATGLSALLEGQVGHDQVQRFLASSKELLQICGGLQNCTCARSNGRRLS